MAWRSGLLILPNALFKFGVFQSAAFLLLLCQGTKSMPLPPHHTPCFFVTKRKQKRLLGSTKKWGAGGVG